MSDPFDHHPLVAFVSAAVPLRIMAILQEYGEPMQQHWNEAGDIGQLLAEKGDLVLFKGGKKGEAAAVANALAQAIAVLSFLPGGIEIFGQRFEAKAYAHMMGKEA